MSKRSTDKTDQHVGARVKSRRMQLGKSQTWLSEQLGLTFQQIQKYENGSNRIGSGRLQQIATALNVPVAYFFKEAPGSTDGDQGADDALRAFTTSRDGLAIVAAWGKLGPKLRGIFAQLVETMAEA